MNPFKDLRELVIAELDALAREGVLPDGLDTTRAAVEPPRDPAHGDVATNAAMVLAKSAGMKPRALAEALAERLGARDLVTEAAVAGPGFINLRIAAAFWHDCLAGILRAGADYGRSDLGAGVKVNVEYVSVNPTGPLHVGHARGAVYGDALAALLERAGFEVTREYYINDAGAQVDALARSTHLRYREALGESIEAAAFEGLYPGDYLRQVGADLAARDGDKWLGADEDEWLGPLREFAIDAQMKIIRDDLAALGVHQEVFSTESALVAAGRVEQALARLEQSGLIYTGVLEPPKGKKPDDWEPRPQTLFRASDFGDDVDRPLKKSDGSWTYFAPDIAYHLDKIERGATALIDVWGADHGGYVKRMKAAVKALSGGAVELDVKLCQLVTLLRAGEPVKMSKRAGTFVTLREVIDEVGKDVVRFIMLTRKNDASLEFDLAKVLEQSRDNPVFYVQYAHARCRSVLRHAEAAFATVSQDPEALAAGPLARLTDPDELGLIRHLALWPRLLEGAAEAHEPHRVAFYLYDLAAAFHAFWTKGRGQARLRFLLEDEPELTAARLALVQAIAQVIASGLAVMGVEPVEEMR
ncbi:MAG: arginine--tRNA ligase [Proteobacteria bacterium]|nr:arginine--tRNA ligase [Pseudomonadota bacterium]